MRLCHRLAEVCFYFAVIKTNAMSMSLSEMILNKIPATGLWFVNTRATSIDISQIIYDLSVIGSVFLEIYTSDKERIVNSVISMITKDRLRSATDPDDRFLIEKSLSYFHDFGILNVFLEDLNEYLPNGCFWEYQVRINDYDPLFIENCEFESILIDDLDVFNNQSDVATVSAMRQIEKLALQYKKTVFVFVSMNSSGLVNDFVLKRIINA